MAEIELKPLFVAALSKDRTKVFQLESLRLDGIQQVQFLPDLLSAIPLKRLYLENMGACILTLILNSVNLTQLTDLAIEDAEYEWPIEAVLAKRSGEFVEDLNIAPTTIRRRQIHMGGHRTPLGTLKSLPAQRLSVVPSPILHQFHLNSILSNNY
ncbi:hypothetical protein BGX29_001823 [Mortierella sp. GBA35]|nr:hypothetical protein BGX29_001823 [Mortierella sp. GBA35]